MNPLTLKHAFGKVSFVEKPAAVLWRYTITSTRKSVSVAPPIFEIGGKEITASLVNIKPLGKKRKLSNGATESIFVGDFAKVKGLQLKLVFRIVPNNPVVRFHYQLLSETPVALTKKTG